MKRYREKGTAAVMSILIAASLMTGCGKKDTEAVTDATPQSLIEDLGASSAGSESSDSAGASTDVEDTVSSGDDYTDNNFYLTDYSRDDLVFTFDKDGNYKESYNLKKIYEKASKQGLKLDYGFSGIFEGIMYFVCSDYNGDYTYRLFAYDPAGDEFTTILESIPNGSINGFGYNKGHISVILEDDSEPASWQVKSYVKNEGSLTYTEITPEYADALGAFSGCQIMGSSVNLGRNGENYEAVLDAYGFVLGQSIADYSTYYKLSTDKTETELTGIDSSWSLLSYDGKRAIFCEFVDSSNKHLYAYDFESQTAKELGLGNSASFDTLYDGKLIYFVDAENEYGVKGVKYYVLDLETGETKDLMDLNIPAGFHEYYSTLLSVFHGKIFFKDFEGSEVKICKMDLNEESPVKADTGCTLEKKSLFDYGKVEYISKSGYCPYCGIPTNQAYYEYPVLDPSKVNNADIINEDLKNNADGLADTYGTFNEGSEFMKDNSCTHEKEYAYQYDETSSSYVDDIYLLEDRYLCINTDGYWYGGGAHGMPDREQYVYDTTTGSRVYFKDFYTGTEEAFKELVATKVKEDYDSYEGDDFKPYFAENSDELYNSAYDIVSVDGCIYFDETGIKYIVYPYDLASYAEGFKEYHLTYHEVFGRDTLTP